MTPPDAAKGKPKPLWIDSDGLGLLVRQHPSGGFYDRSQTDAHIAALAQAAQECEQETRWAMEALVERLKEKRSMREIMKYINETRQRAQAWLDAHPVKPWDASNKEANLRMNRPTIAELEKIIEQGGGKVEIHPDGSVTAISLQEQYNALEQAAQEAGTALKALSDRHAGWEHGMGHCVCEAHQQARAAIDALAKSGVKI
jgi:hypothetical protein